MTELVRKILLLFKTANLTSYVTGEWTDVPVFGEC